MKHYNLNDKVNCIKKEFEGDKVEANKLLGEMIRQAKNQAKPTKCFYCGKQVTSFCNSHSIPKFCLRNIETNGKVLYSNAILEFPFVIKKDNGIKNAGIFHLICNDCDNKIFQHYENPNAYLETPSSKLLAEIAMKCCLKSINKRRIEIAGYKNLYARTKNYEVKQDALLTNTYNALDYLDYMRGFEKAKKLSQKQNNDGYYLIYYDLLDYVVPIAFQEQIALSVDFNGNIVNKIYNMNSDYEIKFLFVCVFPLKTTSAILLFIDNNEKRYKSFYKSFNKLDREKKLSVINYIIFAYAEDFFFSEKIEDKITTKVKELLGQTPKMMVNIDDILQQNQYQALIKLFDLNNSEEIPNYLSKKYSI